MSSFDIFKDLNNEQKEAVTSTEGYVRVIAGAGSGKTRSLTRRYLYLVEELGISTANILCVTFTNKAANEMKKRIRSYTGDKDLGLICTFHSFCHRLLTDDVYKIHYPKNFIVLDNEDQKAILRNVYEYSGINENRTSYKQALKYVSDCKTSNRTEEYLEYLINADDTELFKKYNNSRSDFDKIFYGYIYEQKKNYGLDFNDLIIVALHILENFEEVREKWQNRLEYVMVDEFQDVSLRQYSLCSILSGKHKNLFVVGDPDQTIYSWRGADINAILNFDKVFKGTKTIIMDKNYRSSPQIIDASNSLIKKNKNRIDKQLVPIKQNGIIPVYNHARTIYDEAHWIVDQIKRLNNAGVKYNDIAILYRAHSVSRPIEDVLMDNSIPYIIYSGIGFYERREIKDVISYMRMLTSSDDLSFLRTVNTPRRGIGKERISFLKQYAKEHNCSMYNALCENSKNDKFINTKASDYIQLIENFKKSSGDKKLTDLVKELLDESGYSEMLRTDGDEERLENLSSLLQSITDYENNEGEDVFLEDYLAKIALYTNADKSDKGNKVGLMTVHTAKGLEFPYVFVCALNEGIFPSRRTNTLRKMEEERRLAYVAFTRAKKALFLSDAEGYNYDGTIRYPSRFIFNVEKTFLDYSVELEEQLVEESHDFIDSSENRLQSSEAASSLRIGDTVTHRVFGEGKIIDKNIKENTLTIKFSNTETNRTISMDSDALTLHPGNKRHENSDINSADESVL